MTSDHDVVVLFCDDIRQEMGNKLSLIGCYNEILYVPSIPTILPKLAIFARLTAQSGTGTEPAKIKASMNGSVLGEVLLAGTANIPNDARISAVAVIVVSPLVVSEGKSLIVVDVEYDGVTIRGGQLQISVFEDPSDPKQKQKPN